MYHYCSVLARQHTMRGAQVALLLAGNFHLLSAPSVNGCGGQTFPYGYPNQCMACNQLDVRGCGMCTCSLLAADIDKAACMSTCGPKPSPPPSPPPPSPPCNLAELGQCEPCLMYMYCAALTPSQQAADAQCMSAPTLCTTVCHPYSHCAVPQGPPPLVPPPPPTQMLLPPSQSSPLPKPPPAPPMPPSAPPITPRWTRSFNLSVAELETVQRATEVTTLSIAVSVATSVATSVAASVATSIATSVATSAATSAAGGAAAAVAGGAASSSGAAGAGGAASGGMIMPIMFGARTLGARPKV